MSDDYIWDAFSREAGRNQKRFELIMNILRRLYPLTVQEEMDKLYPKEETTDEEQCDR